MKIFKTFLLMLLVLFAVFAPLLVAAEAAQPEAVDGVTGVWVEYLDTIAKAVFTGVGMFVLWAFKKIFAAYSEKQVYKDAVDALEVGWDAAKEEFVTFTKRAKADGKLTQDEREEARRIAVARAKEVATGPAKDLLMSWGYDKLTSMINRITGKRKGESEPQVVIADEIKDASPEPDINA